MTLVAIVVDAWRAYPADRAARLVAMTSRGIRATDARRYAVRYDAAPQKGMATGPCTQGHTAARDGCQPVDKKGKAIKQGGASQRGIERKQRAIGREAVGKAAAGKDKLGALEHSRAARETAAKSGLSAKTTGKMLDKATGQEVGIGGKIARTAAAEYDHIDHELQAGGIGGPGKGGKIARGAIVGAILAAKTVMGLSQIHGPLATALHHVAGDLSAGVAFWSGADALSTVNVLTQATKLTGKAVNAGIKLMKAYRGGM